MPMCQRYAKRRCPGNGEVPLCNVLVDRCLTATQMANILSVSGLMKQQSGPGETMNRGMTAFDMNQNKTECQKKVKN